MYAYIASAARGGHIPYTAVVTAKTGVKWCFLVSVKR